MELQGKTAFITGAGSGIGKAAAMAMARAGASVAVLAHTKDEIEKTAEEIKKAGGKALALVADVRDSDAMKKAVQDTIGHFGNLDIVVPNAGINGVWAAIDKITPEEWDDTLDTDLKGTFLTVHHAVPHLKNNGGGSIVIVSSINGTRTFSNTGATPYACAKAAQVAFAKMVALELARDKIRVNVVCPGAIKTRIDASTTLDNKDIKIPVEYPEGSIPLTDGNPGTAEDVADLILFLASDRARHITGTPVWIDGGESLLE